MNFRKIERNFRKDMRGISPVIATLLMIAIAVVASLVTYAWVMGYMNFTQTKTGKAILIQSVSTTVGATQQVNVFVQNVGDSSVNLIAGQCLYINGTLITEATTQYATLGAGSTTSITTGARTYTVAHGDVFVVKVTTQDGTFSQLTQTVP
jgi:archaeal type IV pilus assembly protein PilA